MFFLIGHLQFTLGKELFQLRKMRTEVDPTRVALADGKEPLRNRVDLIDGSDQRFRILLFYLVFIIDRKLFELGEWGIAFQGDNGSIVIDVIIRTDITM